jgi:hypothetical protein
MELGFATASNLDRLQPTKGVWQLTNALRTDVPRLSVATSCTSLTSLIPQE